jgi:eukaryotic-like serine/threonine-protein kinase
MVSREPGQLLGGKYRLIRQLGAGGMGSVWLAHHLVLNAPVALKFISLERLDGDALQRFLGEARMAAALRSPHVVQILDYGVDEEGAPHIAMELLEGESLAQRLERSGRLDFKDCVRIVQQVVRAIARAHDAGVVHRDLKPENIFIVKNDDDEIVKVLDFGIAKGTAATLGTSGAASTATGTMLGTPYYMSPEQVDGAKSLDFRTDIWSLGVVVYRCLVGELPFPGDTMGRVVLAICSRPLPIPSRVAGVPAGFDAWFARACARDPNARFGSAREAVAALATLGDRSTPSPSEPVSRHVLVRGASPPSTTDPLATTTGQASNSELAIDRRRGRHWATLAVPSLAAIGLLGAGAFFGLRSWRTPPTPATASTSSVPAAAPERIEPSVAAKPPPASPAASAAPSAVATPAPAPTQTAAESAKTPAASPAAAKGTARGAAPSARKRTPTSATAPAAPAPTPSSTQGAPKQPWDVDLGI